MKRMQKYFLAIIPPAHVQEHCLDLKNEIKEKYQVKYALKSPAHVTLKMPFSYNEAKEKDLISKLSIFLSTVQPFSVNVGGVGAFGRRVIYLKVQKTEPLVKLQQELKGFCRRELNLVEELSDRNFEPHMTVAYKDLKDQYFDAILDLAEQSAVSGELFVGAIHLLKRIEGRWVSNGQMRLGRLIRFD
jgi:2'-5' RNA ligase